MCRCRGNRVSERRTQTPYRLHSTGHNGDNLASAQSQLVVTCQRSPEADFAGYYFFNGPPSSRVRIYDTGFTDDAFRKSVFPEALDLLADAPREFFRVTARLHAGDDLGLENLQVAIAFPGRHRTPQPVRLSRREPCGLDGELHDLFLEDGYAQCPLQHFP